MQVACGDKKGDIRIFDLTKMELSLVQVLQHTFPFLRSLIAWHAKRDVPIS